MRLPRRLAQSVRTKITALTAATTVTALMIAAAALIYITFRDYKAAQLADVTTQAEVLGRASAAALAFADTVEAQKNLAVLSARPDIELAALYNISGSLFASYVRQPGGAAPSRIGSQPPSRGSGLLRHVHPVREGGQLLGYVLIESLDRLSERLVPYVVILGTVMAASLGAALALSGWLQRSVTRPILEVSKAAHAVVDHNDFDVRVPTFGEDEIGALAIAFNRMLDEIGSRTNALVESEQRFRNIADSAPVLIWLDDGGGNIFVNRAYLDYIGCSDTAAMSGQAWEALLHPDDREPYLAAWQTAFVSGVRFDQEFRFRRHDGVYRWMRSVAVPRTTHEGRRLGFTGCSFDIHDARTLSDALRASDQKKDEFLATLGHELRNPLAPIRTAVYLLKRGRDTDREANVVQMLERQVDHMVRLVDDLIDLSRVSRGAVDLQFDIVDVATLLQAAVEISKPLIDRSEHRLTVKLPEKAVHVRGDAVRLAQVVANLLNNAAKYTDDRGHIELAAITVDETVQISVRDTGIGLSREQLPRVFEMFAQVDRSSSRAQGGLGIGLALAQRFAELHGGRIDATSPGLGLGSCFTLHLPVVAMSTSPPAEQSAATSVDQKSVGMRRVLIVDDNIDAASTLAALIETLGAKAHVSHDGPTALDEYMRLEPDVVILDIGMPGMDGLEVARRLRKLQGGRHLRLVALTGWGQAEDRERTRCAGFDDHWVKPVEISTVQAALAWGSETA